MAVHLGERPVAAIIFDLDGTLVDSSEDIAASANHVRVHLGLPRLPAATIRSYVGDGVVRLLERALGHDVSTGRTGQDGREVTAAELAAGLAVFRDHYGAHLLDRTEAYPDVEQVLTKLAAVPLLLATNKPRAFTDQILAGLGLTGHFRRVVGGDEVPRRKPDPGHLAAALVGLAVNPAEVVMVGDSPNDILAARAYGALSVGCTYGLVPTAVVAAARPDHLIDSMNALAKLLNVD